MTDANFDFVVALFSGVLAGIAIACAAGLGWLERDLKRRLAALDAEDRHG
jgi:hypothetical protein